MAPSRSHFWPQITSNGPTAPPWDHSSFPKLGIYDFLIPCNHPACSKIGYKEVKNDLFCTFLADFLMIFYKGNSWNSVSHQLLDLFTSFFLQWCFYSIKSNAILITWFGASVGQIQHTGAWKVGFTPRPIRHKCPHWLQWNSTAMEPTIWNQV